jgi:hypothetical protein
MPVALHILADRDEGLGKVIFIIATIVIWGIGAIAAAVKKAADEKKKRERMIRQQGGYYRPAPPPPQVYNIPPPPPPATKSKKKRRQPVAPPVQAQLVDEGESVVHVQLAKQAVEQPKAAPLAEAQRVARLIHRPDSLRAAFILSEVLAKPVSQRET